MPTTTSSWRMRARQVIADVLAALPPGTSREAKRAAVSAAYPFGAREHHPYKCWLAEAALALGGNRKAGPRVVRIVIDASSGEATPEVRCGWCRYRVDGEWRQTGCLACAGRRAECRRRLATTDWRAWADWQRLLGEADEPGTRLAFADWLEENGWPDDAALVRRGD